ncbi:MAG: TRAP transporter substrate-binding protein DctP [Betaproteobacteria bacterium]
MVRPGVVKAISDPVPMLSRVPRRACALATALALLIVQVGMVAAADTPAHELKLSVALGPAFALGKAAEEWARLIGEQTGKALTARVFPGSTLAQRDPAREFIALREGAADLAVGSTLYWSMQVKELGVASLPWMAPTFPQLEALTGGEVAQQLSDAVGRAGAVLLAIAPIGHRELASVKGAMHAPADLEGFSVRTVAMPLLTDFYGTLGARPAAMSGAATRDAFASGALDGQQGPLAAFAATRLDAMGVRFVTVWGAIGELAVFAVNRQTWDALTEAERVTLAGAARQSAQKLTAAARAESEAALETLRQRGITITRLLPPAQAAFIAAVQPVTARWSAVIGEDLVKAAQAASRAAVP